MHDVRPQRSRPVAAQPPGAAPVHEHLASNEQIKAMLRHFGLRTSLIRLKVIDTLLQAEREARGIGMRGVHGRLADQAPALSFMSVREVLKRLRQEGLVSLNADKTYRIEPAVRLYLAQC